MDEVPDRDWVAHVQSSWKPVVISGFVLKFPWHEPSDVQEAIDLCQSANHTEDATSNDASEFIELELEGKSRTSICSCLICKQNLNYFFSIKSEPRWYRIWYW